MIVSKSKGPAYEGSLYRQASNDKEEILDKVSDPIVFVGLFQLTPAERRIFRTLTKAGRLSSAGIALSPSCRIPSIQHLATTSNSSVSLDKCKAHG